MNKEEIAQWVIDNRYPKSENNKVSDAVMYQTIIDMINTTPTQPALSDIDKVGEEIAQMSDVDFNKGVDELMKFVKPKAAQPALSASYWEQRCFLAEKCIEESPCDPDITKSQIEAFDAYRVFIENNKPAQFTPERSPQEEAERLVELVSSISMSSLSECKIIAQVFTNEKISALQLRGLSTVHEEEVLTILKGM